MKIFNKQIITRNELIKYDYLVLTNTLTNEQSHGIVNLTARFIFMNTIITYDFEPYTDPLNVSWTNELNSFHSAVKDAANNYILKLQPQQ